MLTEPEVLNYFETVLRTVKIPVGIYNNPSATGIDISAALYERIVALDPRRITVSKDGSGDLSRTSDVLLRCKDFSYLQGHARLMLDSLLHGAPGSDFALASVLPEYFLAIYDNVVSGNVEQARAVHDRLLPLFGLMKKYNVTRLAKAIAPIFGLNVGPHRLPVLPLPDADRAEIHRIVGQLGPA